MSTTVFFTLCGVLGVAAFFALLRSGHFLKAFLLTLTQGVASLFAVNLTGMLTGITIAVNWYTLGVCCLTGTPGVIMMLAAKTMLCV